jgi:16S rRNA (uracil1498-N3)-methyltransferase
VVNLEGERLLKRHKHWQGIIISACEQCGRNIVPELSAPQTLHDWLNEVDDNLKLMLDPVGKLSFSVLEKPTGRVTLLVGPEGGLSDTEQGQLLSLGFKGVRMGPRILRTETAAVAALAALQTRWGDYN